MFTRSTILALAATAMLASVGLAPTAASAGWWDKYKDRKDIHHDYVDIRHDLMTGHYADAYHDMRDVARDRRDLFWDRLGF
jgi:hypothetical protein